MSHSIDLLTQCGSSSNSRNRVAHKPPPACRSALQERLFIWRHLSGSQQECRPHAVHKPCSCISTRSAAMLPEKRMALCPWTGLDGTRPVSSKCPETSPSSCCHRAHQNSIRLRIFGSICARLGSQTECLKPMKTSSTNVAMLGRSSSMIPNASGLSAAEDGHTKVKTDRR